MAREYLYAENPLCHCLMITPARAKRAEKAIAAIQKTQVRFSKGSPGRMLIAGGNNILELPSYPIVKMNSVAAPFSIYQGPATGVGVSINAGGSGYTGSPNGIQVPGGSVLTVQGGTGTPAQITVLQVDASGAVLSAVVTTPGNYITPPSFPATCTGGGGSGCTVTILSYVSGSQNNVCQIRSGCVSARAKFDPANPGNYGGTGSIIQFPAQGNYEYVFALELDGNFEQQYAYAGTDSELSGPSFEIFKNGVVTLNTGSNIATPKLIYGLLPDGTEVTYGQIYVPGNVPASFWIEIVDEQTPLKLFTAQVWGVIDASPSGFYPNQFPSGSNIIPIGGFWPQPEGGLVTQVQSSNLVNRWPSMNIPVSGGTSTLLGLPEIFRGYWVGDSLKGQVFYDGDVVIDDSGTVAIQGSNSTFYRRYQYIAGCNTESTPPSGAAPQLLMTGQLHLRPAHFARAGAAGRPLSDHFLEKGAPVPPIPPFCLEGGGGRAPAARAPGRVGRGRYLA